MFRQADGLVQSVMILLAFASVATVTICIYKAWEIGTSRRDIGRALRILEAAPSLGGARDVGDPATREMVTAACGELERYPVSARPNVADGVKERVEALVRRVEARRQRRLSRGLNMLGTIGAAAPFIGLFGTVWGIMNSFIGIARTNTTNLAVVAPGIAEALLATAFGLVAAIPAVLAYNAVTRAVAGYRVRMNDAATLVLCLLSRELDGEPALTIVAPRHAREG